MHDSRGRRAERRRSRRRLEQGGFSLVELSAVVVVVGILGVIAVVGYTRYAETAKFAEATAMVGGIRQAQNAYKEEVGYYADISLSLAKGGFYPAPTPGRFKTAWGGACTVCKDNPAHPSDKITFADIQVTTSEPVQFGYGSIASKPGCDPACKGVSLTHGGAPVSWSPGAAREDWYIVVAYADFDGNPGQPASHVIGSSFSNMLLVGKE